MLLFLVDIFLQFYFREVGFGVVNEGVSFGLFPDFSVAVLVIIYAVFVALLVKNRQSLSFGLVCVAVGGMGNLIPRILFGGVFDYLYFPGLGFWFNLSDILITGGVISYILEVDGNPYFVRRRHNTGNK